MAKTSHVIMLTLIFTAMNMLVDARPLINHTTTTHAPPLATRLKLDEDDGASAGCWDSLFELQACTGEIILFFLNGETYLGKSCCKAIEEIEKKCWPSLMGSLGFTSEEGDILRGYCDAYSGNGDVPTTAPPPQNVNTIVSN